MLEESFGLVSAYHAIRGETHGKESEPTLYWRDRTKDGPTYHIDYVFVPSVDRQCATQRRRLREWCGARLSDHVPIVVDLDA